jgi:predicted Zn finger-like uncharacterized protein
MTTITFACPECQSTLKISERLAADQDVRCPKCSTVFAAPPEMSSSDSYDSPKVSGSAIDEPVPSGVSRNRSGFNRTKKILTISAAIVVLFTAGTAYLVWKTIENWGRNEGTGREVPLAFVPAESTLVVGVDLGALADHPGWTEQIEKGIRSLIRSQSFLDDCKTNTGIEFRELFDQVILAFKLDGLNRGEPPHVTVIAHSKVPFNQNRIRDADQDMFRQVAEGKTYYKRSVGTVMDLSWLFMPSDRILILSNLPTIAEIEALMEKDGTEPLITPDEVRWIQGLQGNPFWAILPFTDSKRDNLDRTSKALAASNVPAQTELAPVLETLSHVKAAGAFARWEEDRIALSLSLECDNEAAAGQGSSRLQEHWDKNPLGWSLLHLFFSKDLQGMTRDFGGKAKFSADGPNIRMTARIAPLRPENLASVGAWLSRIIGYGQDRPAQPVIPPGFNLPPGRRGRPGFPPGVPPNQPPPGKV